MMSSLCHFLLKHHLVMKHYQRKGYHFALATQIIKMFQQFIQELLEFKNGPHFLDAL